MLGASELDAVLQVGARENAVKGQNPFPRPAGHPSLDAAQDTVCFLGGVTKGTITDLTSHSQFHCTARVYLDVHGLSSETSICYWQDQPGSCTLQLCKCQGYNMQVSTPFKLVNEESQCGINVFKHNNSVFPFTILCFDVGGI